jgi:hypothetical protein
MAPLPKQGALLVVAPGQGEVEVITAAIDLNFEICCGIALPIGLSYLQSQVAIVAALGVIQGQHGMTPWLAAEIGGGCHQLLQVAIN